MPKGDSASDHWPISRRSDHKDRGPGGRGRPPRSLPAAARTEAREQRSRAADPQLVLVILDIFYIPLCRSTSIVHRQQTDPASDVRASLAMADASTSDVKSGTARGTARQASKQPASQPTCGDDSRAQAHLLSLSASGLRKKEESVIGLATLLAFYISQLATAQAAACLTTYPWKALNPSMTVEQPLGLLAGTPAMAQTAAPLKLTVIPGNSTLMVSWDPPSGYADFQKIEYDIQYSDDGGSTWWPWHLPPKLEHLKVNILGLKNGTIYVVRVRARDNQGDGAWSASARAMPVGVPAAPEQLNLIAGDQTLELNWAAPVDNGGSEIQDYDIQYSDDGGITLTLLNESIESNALNQEIVNLTNGTTYHLRVRARNDVGHGPWSDWALGQPATTPDPPDSPTLTPGNRQLHVAWDKPPNDGGAPIHSYDIQYSNDNGSTWNSWSLPADSQHLLHTIITGLHNGTTYDVRVRAQNHQGDGPWSTSAIAQPVGAPVAPERPTLTPDNKSLHVSWNAPSYDGGTPISSYDIQYSDDGGSTWDKWDSSINSQSQQATVTGLQNGVVYHVRVRASNSQGHGSWSVAALDRPAGIPSAPTRLTVTPRPNQLEVAWDHPTDDGGATITDYDIQHSNDRGATWRPWYRLSSLDHLTANILGLNNGSTYVVRVRAKNSQGNGPWLASESAMPVGVPAAPTQLDLSVGDRELELSWAAPVDDGGSEISEYSIQYSDNAGATWKQWNPVINAQRLQETITGLQNGTLYRVQVRASNGQGDGPWSVWAQGQPATIPAAPALPTLTPDNRELRVNWDAPDSNGGAPIASYHVQYSVDLGSTWMEWHISADVQPVLQATIAGLENGVTYAVQVRGRNAQGDGPWSASALDQPVGVPTAPPSLTLTPGNHQLHVSWDEPNDNGGIPISSYAIRYSNDSGSTWTSWDTPIDPQSLQSTITGLQNGMIYQVQVRARNRQGDGPWSPLGEAQPRLLPPLPQWIQVPLSGLIWPIIVAIIASSIASVFKIDIRKVLKDGLSFLKQKLPHQARGKSEDPVNTKVAEDKDKGDGS